MTDLIQENTNIEIATETPVLTVTPGAASKIRELLVQRNIPNHALRVFVSGGGCSGFQYGFGFDSDATADDLIFERQGVKVVIDETSLELLAGAEIDYVDELIGASFQIRNPNATSSCGCGNSFAV